MPYLSREQISTPDDTTAVWRYFKLKWFEKFIKSGKLYFSPVCEFNDPWEAAIPKSGLQWRHKKLMEAQEKGDQELQDEFQNILKIEGHRQSFTRAVKASCWHKNDNESEAMWKLYVGSEDGVAVKCTVLDLKNSLVSSLEGVFIGDVNYVDYSDAKFNDVQWYDICFHKREAFSYESELRLAFVNPEELMMKKEKTLGIGVDVDTKVLINEVYVSSQRDGIVQEVNKMLGENGLNEIAKVTEMSLPPLNGLSLFRFVKEEHLTNR